MADPAKTNNRKERRTYWQPPEERDRLSDEAKAWIEENAEAFKSWQEYIEKNGLPLAKYRPF